jgi:hypothetical protein
MGDISGRDLADAYDAARNAGRQRIQERWRFLTQEVRDTLRASGCYSERGAPIEPAESVSAKWEHEAERLEYALGVLVLCARASLPDRNKSGAPLPLEATTPEVLAQCEELAGVPAWRDPEFLRLGLRAVAQHERAEALSSVGPPKRFSAALGCMGAVLYAGLLFLSPVFLASAMVSAGQGDTSGTAAGLYGVAFTAMVILWVKDKASGKHVSPEERAYLAWTQFQNGLGGAPLGAGARSHLAAMAAAGVSVPGVALDLCAALEARI